MADNPCCKFLGSRKLIIHRHFSKSIERSARTIKFKRIRTQKTPGPKVVSDRSAAWNIISTLLPHDNSSVARPNAKEETVLKLFKCPPQGLIYIPQEPGFPNPFVYHSTVNGDQSYIDQPRLSVTKLLVSAWCELRSFFEIFSGSPVTPRSKRMKSGNIYHSQLELACHPVADPGPLKEKIGELLQDQPIEVRGELTKTLAAFKLANDWLVQIVTRLVGITHTKIAREIFVHGFIDIYGAKLLTDSGKLHQGTLVNGVIDIVKINNESSADEHVTAREEIAESQAIDEKHVKVWDLSEKLETAKSTVTSLAKDYTLQVRDMKTRERNEIPKQPSVVETAKMQCMYYALFFSNLARSAEFAYQSCIENGSRREVNEDEPLSIALATELIILNFETIALDCLRLAKGLPIGFEPFDKHQNPIYDTYSLSKFVTESQFRELLYLHHGDKLDIEDFDLSALFRNWKKPLTLRYIAARCGQTYNIFQHLQTPSVCVEYHNPNTRKVFAEKYYPFSDEDIQESILESSQFWSGQRQPRPTEDRSKCYYCDFKNRCPAINSESGSQLAGMLHKLQNT